MDKLVRDIRLAARSLRRAPAFSATTIALLAAGIFVVATTFAVTNAYLVRTMPYPAAERLVHISYAGPGEAEPAGVPTMDWSALSDVIEWVEGGTGRRISVVEGAQVSDIIGLEVAPGSFEPMNIQLAAGRAFTPDEYRAGADKVIIVRKALLRGREFSASPPMFLNIVQTNSGDAPTPYRIIGVLAPNVRSPRTYARGEVEFVIPREHLSYPYMVRLRKGAQIDVVARRVSEAVRRLTPPPPANWGGVHMQSVQSTYVQEIRPILVAVTFAAAMILLIVTANVAVLVVLRARRREREVAIRIALGAGSLDIARILGVEAVILCAAATVIGLMAAGAAIVALGPVIESRLGRPVPGGVAMLSVDATVLLVVVGAALIAALLLTFAPLVLPVTRRFEASLRSGARAGSDGPGVRRARFALVAVQVAASLTLLFGGGLVVRSVRNLVNAGFGYDVASLTRVRMRLPNRTFPDSASIVRYQSALEEAALARTGTPVAITTVFPFYEQTQQRIAIGPAAGDERSAAVFAIGPRYFDVTGIALRAGRVFDAHDGLDAPRVAIVSESMARHLWPGAVALGRQIRTGTDIYSGTPATVWRIVVGVVADVRETHRDDDFNDVYLPTAQTVNRSAWVLVKAGARVREWYAALHAEAVGLNPSVDLGPPSAMADNMRDELRAPEFLMSVLMALALLAVAIALVGIYGVTAYGVEQRRREIAVRAALGATPGALVGLFVAEGGRVVALGIVAGAIGSAWMGLLLQNQVFGVAWFDAATLGGAIVLVATGGTLSAWLPARRAATLDVSAALRAD